MPCRRESPRSERRQRPRQKSSVAFGLQNVVQHHSHHQRDSDRNRKRDRQSRHIDRRHQQQIRQIENGAADQRRDDIRGVRGLNIVQKLEESCPLLPMVKARIREIRKMPIA